MQFPELSNSKHLPDRASYQATSTVEAHTRGGTFCSPRLPFQRSFFTRRHQQSRRETSSASAERSDYSPPSRVAAAEPLFASGSTVRPWPQDPSGVIRTPISVLVTSRHASEKLHIVASTTYRVALLPPAQTRHGVRHLQHASMCRNHEHLSLVLQTALTRSIVDNVTAGAGASSFSSIFVSSAGATAAAANDDPAGRELAVGLRLARSSRTTSGA